MKFIKYWKGKGKDDDKYHLSAKIVYLLAVIYFPLMGILQYAESGQKVVLSVMMAVPIFLTLVLVGDVMNYFGYVNTYTKQSSKIFQHLIKKIEKRLKTSPKFSSKIILARLAYVFTFFIIPVSFVFLLAFGQFGNLGTLEGIEASTGENQSRFKETLDGQILVKPMLNKDYRTKVHYFLGDILNIPILSVCFSNNESINHKEIIEETFNSQVDFEGTIYSIPFRGEICIEIPSNENSIKYQLSTQYLHKDKNEPETTAEGFFEKQRVNVKINTNFIIMTILIVLGWLAICNLIYHVFKDLNEIK